MASKKKKRDELMSLAFVVPSAASPFSTSGKTKKSPSVSASESTTTKKKSSTTTKKKKEKVTENKSISEQIQASRIAAQQHQLRIAQRRVKDLVETLQHGRDEWESQTMFNRGVGMMTDAINSTLDFRFTNEDVEWGFLDDDYLRDRVQIQLAEKMNRTQTQLLDFHESLVSLVNRMRDGLSSFKAYRQTMSTELGSEFVDNQPIFKTHTLNSIATIAEEIIEEFEKDREMKKSIVNDIPLCSSRSVLTTYQSAWLLEPLLDSNRLNLLFSILDLELTNQPNIPPSPP